MLQRCNVKKELSTVYLHLHALEQAVGLDVVEHMGFPEQHDILVIGIDLLVDVLVQRRIAEIDRTALAEVAVEEVVQLLEKLIAEARERIEHLVDVLLKFREHAHGVVAGLDPHQVDVSGFAFDLGSNKHISQGIEEFLLSVHYSPFMLAIDSFAVVRRQLSQFLRRLTLKIVSRVLRNKIPDAIRLN